MMAWFATIWIILSSYVTYAPHYRPGVMENVASNRGMEIVDCMVSSPIEPLGSWVYIHSLVTGYESWCRVTDTSAPQDRDRHIQKNRMIEFGWSITPQMCGITHVAQEPPEACPVEVQHRIEFDPDGEVRKGYDAWIMLSKQMKASGTYPQSGFAYPSIHAE